MKMADAELDTVPSDESIISDTAKPKAKIGKTKKKKSQIEYATKSDFQELNAKLNSLIEMMPVVKKASSDPGPSSNKSRSRSRSNSDSDSDREEGEIDNPTTYFSAVSNTVKEGPNIEGNIAEGVTRIMSRGIAQADKDRLLSMYDTPGNCQRLSVMKCNETIFRSASKATRIKDSKFQSIQQGITKSLTAFAFTFDHIHQVKGIEQGLNKEDTKTALSMISDGMAILADTTHKLDILRRQNFKYEFKNEFSQELCNDRYPVSEKLFGPDSELPDKVKDVSETLKMSQQVSKPKYQPYNYKRSSFLGRSPAHHQVNRGGGKFQYKQNRNPYRRYNQWHQYKQDQQNSSQKYHNQNQSYKKQYRNNRK